MEYQRKIKAEELEYSAIKRKLKNDLAKIIGGLIFICLMTSPLLVIAIAVYNIFK